MLKSMQEILEYGFEILNKEYFNGELPPIVISIMSSPRTNGHFTINKEWRVEDERFNEINISAEHMDRPIENIMGTLMHEMVHYYCQLNGIADVSQNGRYHNRKFKEEAEKRGLIISQGKYIGWSKTEPTGEFKNILKEHGIEKPIDINRDGIMDIWFYREMVMGRVKLTKIKCSPKSQSAVQENINAHHVGTAFVQQRISM